MASSGLNAGQRYGYISFAERVRNGDYGCMEIGISYCPFFGEYLYAEELLPENS